LKTSKTFVSIENITSIRFIYRNSFIVRIIYLRGMIIIIIHKG